MRIIDPPIGPYSPPADIEAWLERLSKMPQEDRAVQRAVAEARQWLRWSEAANPTA